MGGFISTRTIYAGCQERRLLKKAARLVDNIDFRQILICEATAEKPLETTVTVWIIYMMSDLERCFARYRMGLNYSNSLTAGIM